MSYVIKQFNKGATYIGMDSEIRWRSNDRCLPADAVNELVDADLVNPFIQENTDRMRKEELEAMLAEYKYEMEHRTKEQLAEERFEMRAAFGKGETVVNVLTGEVNKL